ncbi:hypothetical protein FSP39_002920 [Pinctada imbricata]|uniref:Opine dehydrogenase domain-containing protein n=1 Tax=Pinctada imbricata TaxID=66713 RepID=A0AA88XPM2_PINIB|nr:hypothetical protein FSP39_002920 [Pinctada imbricata]
MTLDKKVQILVCGGGNGAHCLAGLASLRPNAEVSVLTLYADEAERWTKVLVDKKLKISATYNDGTNGELESRPKLITKDPASVVPNADIIFMVVPAFAHQQYLTEIAKHIKDNTVIVGLPGQAGFEFQCLSILGNKAKTCAVSSFESLPWACRILEFGCHVQILGFKESLGAALLQGSQCTLSAPAFDTIQWILGEKPKIKPIQNYIAVNLMAKSIIHPPLMYGQWSKWNGQSLDEKPLFYQGVDDLQASLLSKVSDEVVATAKAIEQQRSGIDMKDVIHILDWYKEYYRYQVTDSSNLMKAMQTNKAYDGLLHPMKPAGDGKYVPDFSYRYTAEDVPFGLVVMKGIAQIAGVATPVMDEVITWAQGKLGKEYLVGSELKGKDLPSSRAPQSYNFHTLDDLFNV